MRPLAVLLVTLLLMTGCGGSEDPGTGAGPEESSAGAASETPAPEPGPERGSETASETSEPVAAPLCAGLRFDGFTGGGEALDLAAGDPFPGGVDVEAAAPTCYQQGPRGSVELTRYTDAVEGRRNYDEVAAGRGVPLSVCAQVPVTGSRFLEGIVVVACEPESAGVPIPAAVVLVAPLGEQYLRCIAAAPPGQTEATPGLQQAAAQVCGRAMSAVAGP
ncbi:hypothetical protein [Nocardioides nanhaiensis]|uniref:DUF3558 domain-containing protein n=1 Tax=Nocardioides nanhaiensis TaxID=1476871 RepID=A0ABP8VWN8_9ACTN